MAAWKTESDTVPLHTVLIICDEPGAVAAWDSLFNQRNCIVISETSVKNALQTARLVAPSLMLVDMKISNNERASLISGLRRASHGPIILLASADSVQEAIEATQLGADECLMKPVNPAVLVVKAMAWLGHGQRSERLSPLDVNAPI